MLGGRLQHLYALCLLRHVFILPTMLYYLCTSPCFLYPASELFDQLRTEKAFGVHYQHRPFCEQLSPDSSLPGGLGIRSVVQLAPSAFLASAAGSSDLSQQCLGAPLCLPHVCHHCRARVDNLSTHGLSCCKSHASINSLIQKHCLQQESQPTLNPLADVVVRYYIVWDATCPDTLAPSHIALTLWLLRTLPWLPESLDWWQSRQNRRGRPSMRTCRPHTTLSPLALSPPMCLVPKPSPFSRSLAIASGHVLVNPFPSTIFCNRLGSPG